MECRASVTVSSNVNIEGDISEIGQRDDVAKTGLQTLDNIFLF